MDALNISFERTNNSNVSSILSGNDPNAVQDLANDYASMDHGPLKYIILVSYMTTFVLGILGNGLVIYIIASFRKVRIKSVANYYIWNLSFADELFIMVLPLFCYATYTKDWPFGGVCCKIAYAFREINKFASVFTLVALSVDRYLATCHQLSYLRTIQVGKLICAGIWLVCAVIATPYIMYANTIPTAQGHSCRMIWPTHGAHIYTTSWTIFQFIVGLVGPFLVILTSYILLKRRMGQMFRWQVKSARERKPGRKLTQTVVIVVVMFLVCQAPYHVLQIISAEKTSSAAQAKARGDKFRPSELAVQTFVYFNALAQVLVFVSSCCNPVIYALFNENFRKLYSIVLCKCQRGRRAGDELRELEVDGKYVPISLKIQVTFHVPCVGNWTHKSNIQNTMEIDNGTEVQAIQTTSTAV